ncbi:MAG: MFS transporter, partial [Thermodesulfobacteriota bacterium]|nr:MFS transporter [Thermodesulfobacteriota bacterium]
MVQTEKHSGIFFGWWVVIACAIIGLFAGSSRFSFTMFLPTLLEDLGWTRAMLGFGFTLHMWTYAVVAILVGILVDRYGARLVMTGGGLFLLLGLVLTSTMTAIWQFYLYYGIILGIGVSSTLAVPGIGTARKWFTRKAGLAVAVAAGGGGLGLALMAFVAPSLISAYGWR